MRRTSAIFHRDIFRLLKVPAAWVVIIGISIIPALCAWINITGFWDPYSNAKNLSFAVANADEGYRGDLLPMKINVGDEVLSALRANEQLHWGAPTNTKRSKERAPANTTQPS